ncbi:hypothetical protein [Aggregatilinea lenta]|uniref:hypothetical protein n=1 Tax=Aggregatilinea lenta TaxID=913108 RepID=UPI000E5AAD69|nr:hypothetical protein [Aggregatilinea lenta]
MSLNNPIEPDPDFTITFDDDALCTIAVRGDFMPDLIRTIAQQVHTEHDNGQAISGILLDLQAVQLISLIRLSGLLDLISRYEIPIGVVLEMTVQQQRLVELLHQTLPYRERVAYFDVMDDARAFVDERRAAG